MIIGSKQNPTFAAEMPNRKYKVKELFYTLQGEGHHAGRPAVFLRFTGCNLWNGREADRHKSICRFCDTDFIGTDGENGGTYSAESLAQKAISLWPSAKLGKPYIVCTGGEPLLQLDEVLIGALHQRGLEIAVETNGTILAPAGIDWLCVSPKAGATVLQNFGHELKLVYPQDEAAAQPEKFVDLAFDHHYLQPLDGAETAANTRACVRYCLANPQWKVSLQTHKILEIP
jgi:7-carboxy-7-deazaguanine synthase (Cx14CxxC type)